MMRVRVAVAVVIACTSLAACSTKKKLDDTLDNANRTISNANKRIDELADLASDLKTELSEATRMTSMEASRTLADIGDAAGGIPATGGEVKGSDSSADLDEDGKPDTVTAVDYDDRTLWLVEASSLDALVCETQLYLVTDKPPENLLAWGLYAEGCGAMACPPAEIEEEEPDFDTCECVDAAEQPVDCQTFMQSLGGEQADPTDNPTDDPTTTDENLVYCEDQSEVIDVAWVCDGAVDCSDSSDELYCQ